MTYDKELRRKLRYGGNEAAVAASQAFENVQERPAVFKLSNGEFGSDPRFSYFGSNSYIAADDSVRLLVPSWQWDGNIFVNSGQNGSVPAPYAGIDRAQVGTLPDSAFVAPPETQDYEGWTDPELRLRVLLDIYKVVGTGAPTAFSFYSIMDETTTSLRDLVENPYNQAVVHWEYNAGAPAWISWAGPYDDNGTEYYEATLPGPGSGFEIYNYSMYLSFEPYYA